LYNEPADFPQLVKHKDEILGLLSLLVDKTKSERGYTLTGRLLTRILHVLSSVHVLNSRFMNTKEWNDPGEHITLAVLSTLLIIILEFDRDHNLYWGHQYEAKEIEVEWHGASKRFSRCFKVAD
jgi:proteasome activator subunit 4